MCCKVLLDLPQPIFLCLAITQAGDSVCRGNGGFFQMPRSTFTSSPTEEHLIIQDRTWTVCGSVFSKDYNLNLEHAVLISRPGLHTEPGLQTFKLATSVSHIYPDWSCRSDASHV